MPKATGQKLRILYLLEILKRRTDETHSLTTAQLITALARYGVTADRKTIYDDLQALEDGGYDLLRAKGKKGGVKLLSRDFDLPEVKMLVDAVQSSHFITEEKSRRLTGKLGALASEYQEKALSRHFYIGDRIKSDSASVLYT
ncbi:MAG: WYL domain-containing protein, partial [Clostridia bacterium]|nr:WYL domain-containing protein [Clostridia bacterium]